MSKRVHHLKTWPEYFRQLKSGEKTFEVRKDDRFFQVGEELLLEEFVPEGYFPEDEKQEPYLTGNICHRKITYVLRGGQFGIEKGYVVLGLSVV